MRNICTCVHAKYARVIMNASAHARVLAQAYVCVGA